MILFCLSLQTHLISIISTCFPFNNIIYKRFVLDLIRLIQPDLDNFDPRIWIVAVSIVLGTFVILAIGLCIVLTKECYQSSQAGTETNSICINNQDNNQKISYFNNHRNDIISSSDVVSNNIVIVVDNDDCEDQRKSKDHHHHRQQHHNIIVDVVDA